MRFSRAANCPAVQQRAFLLCSAISASLAPVQGRVTMGAGASAEHDGEQNDLFEFRHKELSKLAKEHGADFQQKVLENMLQLIDEGKKMKATAKDSQNVGENAAQTAARHSTGRSQAATLTFSGADEVEEAALESEKHAAAAIKAAKLGSDKVELAQREARIALQLAKQARQKADDADITDTADRAAVDAKVRRAMDLAAQAEENRRDQLFRLAESLAKEIEDQGLLEGDDEEVEVKEKKIEEITKAKDRALRGSNFDKAKELHDELEKLQGKVGGSLGMDSDAEAERLKRARHYAQHLGGLARETKPLVQRAVTDCEFGKAKRVKELHDRAIKCKNTLLQYVTRYTANKQKEANPVDRFKKVGSAKEQGS